MCPHSHARPTPTRICAPQAQPHRHKCPALACAPAYLCPHKPACPTPTSTCAQPSHMYPYSIYACRYAPSCAPIVTRTPSPQAYVPRRALECVPSQHMCMQMHPFIPSALTRSQCACRHRLRARSQCACRARFQRGVAPGHAHMLTMYTQGIIPGHFLNAGHRSRHAHVLTTYLQGTVPGTPTRSQCAYLQGIKRAVSEVGELDGVTTFCELAVPLAVRIAEKLGLPHNTPDSIDFARDKVCSGSADGAWVGARARVCVCVMPV
eukprot:1152043-Pelagomonas_calceolata.AAC.4